MPVMENAETKLREEGREVTIRRLWITLVDRCAGVDDPDLRAAAGLAGMAAGLATRSSSTADYLWEHQEELNGGFSLTP